MGDRERGSGKSGRRNPCSDRGYEENVVQKELPQTFSSGPINLRTSAVGHCETSRGTPWDRTLSGLESRLYTRGQKRLNVGTSKRRKVGKERRNVKKNRLNVQRLNVGTSERASERKEESSKRPRLKV